VTQKNPSTAKGQLRHMQRLGLLGFFGYVGLIGHGKTPKVYFLTRKGFELLLSETDIPAELLGSFKWLSGKQLLKNKELRLKWGEL
jgi:hypothetical protein